MADSTATGWYYLKAGAAAGQQVGPLSWEQLFSAQTAGALQSTDLVWHQTMPQWLPATQVPGLFPAAQTATYAGAQPSGYPGAPYQQPSYTQPSYQQGPYQQSAYPAAGQPAWAGQASYQTATRKRSSVAAWLIPLIALVIVGGGLGAYFGFWYHKGGGVTAADLAGHWEGTLKYTSIELNDPTEEDLALREATLNQEIPVTLDLTPGADAGARSRSVKALADDESDDGEVTGSATLTMDLTVIDESYGEVTNEMTFTYSGGKLAFVSEDSGDDTETVTAEVSKDGDTLVMEGTTTFEDADGSGKAVWTMSKRSSQTGTTDEGDSGDATEDDGNSGGDTSTTEDVTPDETTVVTENEDDDAFTPADLNGSWEGNLTVTYFSGDPWAERGLTYDVLDSISGTPIPVTMTITVDENGSGTGQMIVSASAVGATFDIGTADMPMTTSGMELTFTPESWPWGVPTMTGDVTQIGDSLRISGSFMYESAASVFGAGFSLKKQ